ncbi:recombination directionality factor [Microbacterium phage Zeta1847]|uniref:Uncharacterized protein n=1 Tax=Microbacterium phage Zeta1847 TaxID=2201444 RepID=A0A2Z4Q9B6_9CAUD|nr:hypothetical protein HOT46_gp33 [Microbacterium phage Zeta1847]AWY06667.1 recombination directionality factor [Microbacterium phage Zeta1847]
MGLKIFGDADPTTLPEPTASVDDVVGRFRSGHRVNGEPEPLSKWRITTSDDEVAATVADLFEGTLPQQWETDADDDLEVFTDVAEVDIIIERPSALRERMVLFKNNKLVYASDGAHLLDSNGKPTETPDPHAALGYRERKALGEAGTGPNPDIDLFFRLAAKPELGVFLLHTTSWPTSYEFARIGLADKLAAHGGPVTATLKLDPRSFRSKTGKNKGELVTYTATTIDLKDNA